MVSETKEYEDERDKNIFHPKVFVIGFNKCGTKVLCSMLAQLGYKPILYGYGHLALRMMENFKNGFPLLQGYDGMFNAFIDFENVDQNIIGQFIFFKTLDEQYPGSKFILNTRSIHKWMTKRIEDKSYLDRAKRGARLMDDDMMIRKWSHQWHSHHENVKSYFRDRMDKDIIIYDVDNDHPIKIFKLLHKPVPMWNMYEHLWTSNHASRFEWITTTTTTNQQASDSYEGMLDIYTLCLPSRRAYMIETLQSFPFESFHVFESIQTKDLEKHEYQSFSTIYLIGPNIIPCTVCDKVNAHESLYHKETRLCVHLSYMSCIRHAIHDMSRKYVMIFEDDVYFEVTYNDLFSKYIHEFIEDEYDALYLGYCYCKDGQGLRPTSGSKYLIELPPFQSISCLHAVVYKKSYLQKIFSQLLPQINCTDEQMNHIHILNHGKIAIPDQALVFQDRDRFESLNLAREEGKLALFH